MSKIPKRKWEAAQKAKEKPYVSHKSDSLVFCYRSLRPKHLYENERKAQLALEYNREPGCIRYYVCDKCMGYHLTSKTKEEYWAKKRSMQPLSYTILRR